MDLSFIRTSLLLGESAMEKLAKSKVIIFGVGGVGSFVAESIARCNVGNITLVDSDTVSISNINRQLIALHSTVGKDKVEVMKERILDINPNCKVTALKLFYNEETKNQINLSEFDYVVDCIDTMTAKLVIAEFCYKNDVKIIASMGTGNKLDPTKFQISDINKTSVCPLARVMRKELKDRGVKKLKVLYSEEIPQKIVVKDENTHEKRNPPASCSFVPSVAGLIIGGEVVKELANI